jgi:iron(III) transport system ATP-binding protein
LLRIGGLSLTLLYVGCSGGQQPTLSVKQENYWSMPPDGPRVPAPRGMTVSPEGEYLVLDNAGRVLVFDKDGTFQRHWWMPEYSVGKPEGICVLKDGRIAVADTHYHRVVFFDREGHVTGMFGQYGKGPGEFVYPVRLTQDADQNLYVCEYGQNDRVQKFRPDGTFVLEFGSFGTDAGQFQRPSGIAWFEGRVYVVDAFNNRVQVFSEDGKLVAILESKDRISEVHYPYDIAVTERGELFVVEYAAGRVSKFDRTGKLLGRYGHTGTGAGQFSTPWGMTVDKRGRVYVCDTGNRRIVELDL